MKKKLRKLYCAINNTRHFNGYAKTWWDKKLNCYVSIWTPRYKIVYKSTPKW